MANKEISKTLKEVLTSVAIQVARLRRRLGYTQKELASEAYLNPYLISCIENAECKDISIRTLVKIAGALHARLGIKFI